MSEPLPAPAANRYAVLAIRDLRLYLVARFVASFAQQMLGTAVGWELFNRTHSALALGFVGLTQIGPLLLLTLPAGHVADQHSRRNIVLWMQALTALSCAGLTFVSWRQAPVAWTYGFLFLSGVARSFLWPASGAYLPQLVPRHLLADAVTWSSGSFQLSAALGPAAGGFIIAATRGAAAVYAFNVVAGIACCGLIALVRTRPEPAKPQRMTLANLGVGLRFVFGTPVILGTITLDLFAVLLGGATALLPVYASDILHVGPDGLGLLKAALPVGSASMAFFLAHRPPMRRAGHALLLAVAGFGAATLVFGLSRSFYLSLGMMFVCGATDNISVVVRHTLVQVLTPDEMRGRVSAINSLFIGASNEFGEVESGTVAHFLGPVFAVVSGGIGTVLVVIATALLWPDLRRIGRLDEVPAADA
ncbi:MAG: MFS transporter [Gluconacetobacter diazotrophicus]|nr:MFS transporter [Gluconacetobacter diazotrophicus]